MASFRCEMADVIARVKYASNKSEQEIEFQYERKSCSFVPSEGPSNNNSTCSHTAPGLLFCLPGVLHLDVWLVTSYLFSNKMIPNNIQKDIVNKMEKVSLEHLHKGGLATGTARMSCASYGIYRLSLQITF